MYCNFFFDDIFGEVVKRVYYYFNMIVIFLIFFLMIVFLYIVIIVILKRRKVFGFIFENFFNNSDGFWCREVVKKKVFCLVFIVVIVFVFCWFLYYVRFSMYVYGYDFFCDWLYVWFVLVYFNSVLNLCLYVIFSENYCRGFKKILV